jgi:SAM-dependent methyltransferase
MNSLYQQDLAHIQAAGFGAMARGAAPEIVRRLRASKRGIRRVIDVGRGAGPLAQALTEAGYEVIGVDSSPELLEMARAAVPSAQFVNASIYEMDIPACEAIIALGEPLTYHADGVDADLQIAQFFRRASAVLPEGGVLLFVECGAPSLTGRFWGSGDDWAVLTDTVEDPASRTLVRDIQTFRRVGDFYRRGREVHRVRLFDSNKMRDDLVALGFTVETAQAYGSQALGPRRRAFFASRL